MAKNISFLSYTPPSVGKWSVGLFKQDNNRKSAFMISNKTYKHNDNSQCKTTNHFQSASNISRSFQENEYTATSQKQNYNDDLLYRSCGPCKASNGCICDDCASEVSSSSSCGSMSPQDIILQPVYPANTSLFIACT